MDLQSLQEATKSWSAFDLTTRRTQLTQTVQNSRDHRETSQVARKQLADLTRKFKKTIKVSNNTTLEQDARVTIKAFQDEIDNLTRRYKSSDNSFLSLYQSLYDLPDPGDVLGFALEIIDLKENEKQQLKEELRDLEMNAAEMAKVKVETSVAEVKTCSMEELGELEELRKQKEQWKEDLRKKEDQWSEEVASLKREVAEYEVEFKSLKNQDITIRKLESKITDLERAREEEVSAAIRKVQEELTETEGRRASDALEREAALERKLQSLELELKAERAGREVSQAHILQAEEGADQREAAWEAQRRILIDDSERLREALHHATTERDELKMKVAAIDTPSSSMSMSPPPSSSGFSAADILAERRAYEAEVDELSHSLSTLREELQGKDDNIISLQSSLNQLQQQRDNLNNQVSQLQTKLENAPSQSLVENMKRELRVLKRLEYNADDQLDDDDNNDDEDDLQTIILGRLRKMEADLLKERREKEDIENQLEEVQKQLENAENINDDAQLLISKLELDLHNAFQADPTRANNSTDATTAPSDPNLLQTILDSENTNTSTTKASTNPSPSPPESNNPSSDHTVATILISQRDRLKSRCEALEAERDSFKKELQLQVTLSDSLKTDNTKLYEKLRFLQNFAANSKNKPMNTSSLIDRDVDLEALEQRYEASVDPFKQFNRTERLRKLKEMSHMERMVFYAAKTVLSSKQMRTALFIYVCSMHLLVFITTYHWAHETCAGLDEHDMPHMHGGIPLDESVHLRGSQ